MTKFSIGFLIEFLQKVILSDVSCYGYRSDIGSWLLRWWCTICEDDGDGVVASLFLEIGDFVEHSCKQHLNKRVTNNKMIFKKLNVENCPQFNQLTMEPLFLFLAFLLFSSLPLSQSGSFYSRLLRTKRYPIAADLVTVSFSDGRTDGSWSSRLLMFMWTIEIKTQPTKVKHRRFHEQEWECLQSILNQSMEKSPNLYHFVRIR